MKKIFSVIIALSLVLLLGSCGKTSEAVKEEQIELTFSTSVYVEEPHRVVIDKLLNRYAEIKPNVKISIFGAGWADYWNNLTTEVLAGNEADIIQVYPYNIPSYHSLRPEGVSVDITSLMKKSGIESNNLSGQEFCTFDGKILGLANYAWGTTGLFYRKSMLDEKDINPEDIKTQDDFLEACRKFTEDGKYGMGVVVSAHSFVVSEWSRMLARPVSNGLYFGEGESGPYTSERVNVNNPANVWSAQWWQEFILKEKAGKPVPDKKDSRELFWNSEVPFNHDGPWFVGMTKERDQSLFDDIGLIPQFDVVYEGKTYKPNPTNYPLVTVLSKSSPYQDEAWEFMVWMTSDEAQKIIAECGMIPSSKSYASTEEYTQNHALEQMFLQFAENNYGPMLSDPAIPQQGEIEQVMIDATQAMFSEQGANPRETLDKAQQQIQEIMSK